MVSRWYKRFFYILLFLLVFLILSPFIIFLSSSLFYSSQSETMTAHPIDRNQLIDVDVSLTQDDLVAILNDKTSQMKQPVHIKSEAGNFELIYPISYLGVTSEAILEVKPFHTVEGDLQLDLEKATLGNIELSNRLVLQLLNQTPANQYMTINADEEFIQITSEQLSEWIGYPTQIIEVKRPDNLYHLKFSIPRTALKPLEVTSD